MATKEILIDWMEEGARPNRQVSSVLPEPSNILTDKGGLLLYLLANNTSAGDGYLQVHDAAAVPADGAIPLVNLKIAAGATLEFKTPIIISNGAVVLASSTSGTLTHSAGTKQVETAVIDVPTVITGEGNATVTVASSLFSNVVLTVALAQDLTASQAATAIRAALNANSTITTFYTVGGADANVTLTAKIARANDANLNIGVIKSVSGGCTGLTDDATSDNTTAGVAPTIALHVLAQMRV